MYMVTQKVISVSCWQGDYEFHKLNFTEIMMPYAHASVIKSHLTDA